MIEKIAKFLSEISKSLKDLTQIQKERLELKKKGMIDDKEYAEIATEASKVLVGKIKQDEKMADDILEMLGIPKKIDINGISEVDSSE